MSATTYLLRTTDANGRAYNGFTYPESGRVAAPDWDPRPVCGGGLHGLLMGAGDANLMCWEEGALWWVLAVDAETVVAIGDAKVKVPEASIAYRGDRGGAIEFLLAHGADPSTIVCGSASATGDSGSASATGDYGSASATKLHGLAHAGFKGWAVAGPTGVLLLEWWDEASARRRVVVAYVGEDGIEPGVPYGLDDAHRPVRADINLAAYPIHQAAVALLTPEDAA